MANILDYLNQIGVEYKLTEHNAVSTIAEMSELIENIEGSHYKNLFVRNQKGTEMFLVVLSHDRKVDMKQMGQDLGCGKLSFCSEKRLKENLGITAGAVSPFSLINNTQKNIKVVLDKSIATADKVNFHPNRNTAMLTLDAVDLIKFLESLDYNYAFY